MKKLVPTISLMMGCFWLVSCANSQPDTAQETPTSSPTTVSTQAQVETSTPVSTVNPETVPTTTTTPKSVTNIQSSSPPKLGQSTTAKQQANTTPVASAPQPKIGIVKEMVNGDLKCYVTLEDEKGKQHHVGAVFEVCNRPETFLNKKVSLVYGIESVNDCQSAEPCGKSKQESLIRSIKTLEGKPRTKPEIKKPLIKPETKKPLTKDSQTFSNSEWKITIGNSNSWKGVNGTGNLTYSGCDAKGKCINLTGGKITCRDGKCLTGWRNKDYVYVLEQPITEDGKNSDSAATLTVRQGANVILKTENLKITP